MVRNQVIRFLTLETCCDETFHFILFYYYFFSPEQKCVWIAPAFKKRKTEFFGFFFVWKTWVVLQKQFIVAEGKELLEMQTETAFDLIADQEAGRSFLKYKGRIWLRSWLLMFSFWKMKSCILHGQESASL